MNKEYIINNGTTIISNTKGELRSEIINGNIDEILTQENVIEDIKKDINRIKKDIELIPQDIKRTKLNIMIITMASLLSAIGIFIFTKNPLAIYIPCGTGLIYDTTEYLMNVSLRKVLTANTIQIKLLKERLTKEEKELENIKKETVIKPIKENISYSINDKKKLDNIQYDKDIYNLISQNYRILYRNYKKNKLDLALEDRCTEEQIEEIAIFMEENGPVMSLQKRR